MGTDPFRVLDLTPGCTEDELKAAYRRAARAAHPDAGGDEERFRAVRAAYEQLLDPAARSGTSTRDPFHNASSQHASSQHASSQHAAPRDPHDAPTGRTAGRSSAHRDTFDTSDWFDQRARSSRFAPFLSALRTDRPLVWLRDREAARIRPPRMLAHIRPSPPLTLLAILLTTLRISVDRLPYTFPLPHPVLLGVTLVAALHLLPHTYPTRPPLQRRLLQLASLVAVYSWVLPLSALFALGVLLYLSTTTPSGSGSPSR